MVDEFVKAITAGPSFSPNSNSFEVFSHSKGFGAELLSAQKFRGRFDQGSAKVPPRFHQLLTRFHQGSTKVSRRLHNFRDLSGLLIQIAFVSERILRRVPPITSWHLLLSSFNSFWHFSLKVIALGSSAIVKVLGQNDTFCLLGFFAQMAFASQKVFGEHCFVHSSQSLPRFFGVNGCCFRKGSVEGSPNYSLHLSPKWLCFIKSSLERSANCAFYTFISQSPGVKVAWIVDMSQPYKSSPQKLQKTPSWTFQVTTPSFSSNHPQLTHPNAMAFQTCPCVVSFAAEAPVKLGDNFLSTILIAGVPKSLQGEVQHGFQCSLQTDRQVLWPILWYSFFDSFRCMFVCEMQCDSVGSRLDDIKIGAW